MSLSIRAVAVLFVAMFGACGQSGGNAADAAPMDGPGSDALVGCGVVELVADPVPGEPCRFVIPPPLFASNDPRNITVWLDGFQLPLDRGHAEGWDYGDPNYTTVELYGPLCEGIVDGTYRTVTVIYDCPFA